MQALKYFEGAVLKIKLSIIGALANPCNYCLDILDDTHSSRPRGQSWHCSVAEAVGPPTRTGRRRTRPATAAATTGGGGTSRSRQQRRHDRVQVLCPVRTAPSVLRPVRTAPPVLRPVRTAPSRAGPLRRNAVPCYRMIQILSYSLSGQAMRLKIGSRRSGWQRKGMYGVAARWPISRPSDSSRGTPERKSSGRQWCKLISCALLDFTRRSIFSLAAALPLGLLSANLPPTSQLIFWPIASLTQPTARCMAGSLTPVSLLCELLPRTIPSGWKSSTSSWPRSVTKHPHGSSSLTAKTCMCLARHTATFEFCFSP